MSAVRYTRLTVPRPFLVATHALAVALIVLVGCGGDDEAPADGSGGTASPSTPLSAELTTGVATFYDFSGSKQVACSFPVTADTDIAAMNDPEYAKAAACGSCLAVSGPKGKVTIRVVDRCPGCGTHHIDLSAEAFAKIADPIKGRVPITYQLVSCPVTGNMSYHVKEGSSKFWTAIQIRDHKVPIKRVEYKKKGVYTDMPRVTYNYFVDTKGVGDQPDGVAIRITAEDGQTVEDIIPTITPDKVFPGAVQFK